MYVVNDGVGLQAASLRHELGSKLRRTIDGDARGCVIVVATGLDLELCNVKSGRTKIKADLFAHGDQ